MVKRVLSALFIFLMALTVTMRVASADDETAESFEARTAGMVHVKNLRHSIGRGTVRVVLDLTASVEYEAQYLDTPSRIVIDLQNAWLDSDVTKLINLNSTVVTRIRAGQFDDETVRIVITTSEESKIFELDGGTAGRRLVIDVGTPEPEPEPKPESKSESESEIEPSTQPPSREPFNNESTVTDEPFVDEPFSDKPVVNKPSVEETPVEEPKVEENPAVNNPFELPQELKDKADELEREREALRREREALEAERQELERRKQEAERQKLERELAEAEAERQEAERQAIEKERAALEKERATLEKERAAAEAERQEAERKEQERIRKEQEKERKEREKQERKERKEREKQEKQERRDKKDSSKTDGKPESKVEEDSTKPFSNDELEKRLRGMTNLDGKKIAIDPGHGGNDAGAIGPSGVMEKTVTLRVALALEKMLKSEGAEVIMTRRDDVEVSPKGKNASAVEELKERCEVANRVDADIFISIHADSFTNPNARGTTGYYYSLGSANSKRLADLIRKALIEQIKTPSRGTQPCNFYVVRNTDMPATLVELAFISNPDEEKLLNSKEGIQKAAQGILDGIEDYFG